MFADPSVATASETAVPGGEFASTDSMVVRDRRYFAVAPMAAPGPVPVERSVRVVLPAGFPLSAINTFLDLLAVELNTVGASPITMYGATMSSVLNADIPSFGPDNAIDGDLSTTSRSVTLHPGNVDRWWQALFLDDPEDPVGNIVVRHMFSQSIRGPLQLLVDGKVIPEYGHLDQDVVSVNFDLSVVRPAPVLEYYVPDYATGSTQVVGAIPNGRYSFTFAVYGYATLATNAWIFRFSNGNPRFQIQPYSNQVRFGWVSAAGAVMHLEDVVAPSGWTTTASTNVFSYNVDNDRLRWYVDGALYYEIIISAVSTWEGVADGTHRFGDYQTATNFTQAAFWDTALISPGHAYDVLFPSE